MERNGGVSDYYLFLEDCGTLFLANNIIPCCVPDWIRGISFSFMVECGCQQEVTSNVIGRTRIVNVSYVSLVEEKPVIALNSCC